MRERYLFIDQCKRRSYLFSSDYSGLLENPVKTLTEFFCEYQRNEPETIVPGSPSVSFTNEASVDFSINALPYYASWFGLPKPQAMTILMLHDILITCENQQNETASADWLRSTS